MGKLEISLACCDYDRTRALFSGRVNIEGCETACSALEPEEAFHRAFKFQEFDISELSLSSYCLQVSRGTNPYVAIPAFVSRLFRHSGIYIRTDRGIRSPADLIGKTIGLPEYQITANVWIRGILQDEYGVAPGAVHWRQGGQEEPGRDERTALTLPPEIDLQPIPPDRSLSQMLESGELDGMIGARAPTCFLRGVPHVARMFPDYRRTEEDYFSRTGIFPIMHLVVIRRAVHEANPRVAQSLYRALQAAKAAALAKMRYLGALRYMLPWLPADIDEIDELFGGDPFPYGLEPNRHALETLIGFMVAQGMLHAPIPVEDLFVPVED